MQELDASLATFVPVDRRRAIREGLTLGPLVTGTALFADLSGFTPLTHRLMEIQGADRGADSLARHLAQMFDVLVLAAHENGGSVISFAGDAITCWFDGDDGHRAVRCGLRMQAELPMVGQVPISADEVVTVSLKVAAATGEALRCVVGAPEIQLIDVLAGTTVDLMAAGEHVASPGDVVVDQRIAARVAGTFPAAEWRSAEGARFALVEASPAASLTDTVSATTTDAALADPAGNWLLAPVYERFKVESRSFIGGFRNIVVLFLQFGDLDFEHDPDVGEKLADFSRWVQVLVSRFGGAVVGLTLGDKGSYLQVSFGAVQRHEDDVQRALAAAIELRTPPGGAWGIDAISMGITEGLAYVGPYGSSARRTFGALGHSVNLAARLMATAQPGQILLSEDLARDSEFVVEAAGQAQLKGVTEPVELFNLVGRAAVGTSSMEPAGVEEPANRAEWAELIELTNRVVQGGRAFVLIEGPAGIGKSHLMAAMQRTALKQGFVPLIGGAASVGGGAPYQAVRSGLRRLLGLEAEAAGPGDNARLEVLLAALGEIAQERASLLNPVVGSTFPDSEIVGAMLGQVRADNTIQLVMDLVDHSRGGDPLFIGVEDAQQLDSATWALVRELAVLPRALIAMAARTVDPTVDRMDRVEWDEMVAAGDIHRMDLGPLSADAVTALVASRLDVGELPGTLSAFIVGKAEGNPLFAEELAYALRDAGRIQVADRVCTIVGDTSTLDRAAVSNTIEGVVLGRIDLLPGPLQLSVRVASVIGELFGFDLLHDVHPVVADRAGRKGELDELAGFDITALARQDPVLEYVFRHAITRDVAYGSLIFGQRQQLHALIGSWYEDRHGDDLTEFAAVLAHHWTLAANREKAVKYLDLAGFEALKSNANREAVHAFREAARIGADPDAVLWGTARLQLPAQDRAERHYGLGEALYRLGDLEGSNAALADGLRELGHTVADSDGRKAASILRHVASQVRRRGRPPARARSASVRADGPDRANALAVAIHERMLETSFMLNDTVGTAYSTLHSLVGAEALGPSPALADAHSKMSMACGLVPLHRAALVYERSAREMLVNIDDPVARGNILMSISMYRAGIGDAAATGPLLDEALALFRRLGNRERQRICLELLRLQAWFRGDLAAHRRLLTDMRELAVRDDDVLYHSLSLTAMATHSLMESTDVGEVFELADSAERLGVETVVEPAKIAAARATAYLNLADPEQAFGFSQTAVKLMSQAPPTSFGLLQVYTLSVQAALRLVEVRGADDLQAVQNAKRACRSLAGYARVFPIGQTSKLLAQGELRRLTGRAASTEAMFRDAVSSAARLQMHQDLAVAQFDLARVLPEGAERTQLLKSSQRILRRLGFGYNLAQVEGLLGT